MATVTSLTKDRILELMAGWESVSGSQAELNAALANFRITLDANDAALTELDNIILPQLRADLDANDILMGELNDVILPQLQADLAQNDLELANLNTVLIPQLNDMLASNDATLTELNDVTIPALNAELDAAQVDFDTLNTTTLPALNAELDAAQTDINTLNTTTIPALNAELDAAQARITDEVDALNASLATKSKHTLSPNVPGTTANNAGDVWEQHKAGDTTKIIGRWRGAGGTAWTVMNLDATYIPLLDIGSGTVGDLHGDRITANTLNASKIVAGSITTDRMTVNTILGDVIKANTLNASKIVAGSITTDQMTANTIDGNVITANTLNASKIVTGSITTNHMTANTINGDRINANTLNASKIVAGSITTDQMTANTINGDRITANTLNAAKIVAGSITTDQMTANTINGDRINANTLNASKIVAGSINTDHMTANTINGDRIAANTLHADRIVANTITGDQIAAGSISASRLMVSDMTNMCVDPGFDGFGWWYEGNAYTDFAFLDKAGASSGVAILYYGTSSIAYSEPIEVKGGNEYNLTWDITGLGAPTGSYVVRFRWLDVDHVERPAEYTDLIGDTGASLPASWTTFSRWATAPSWARYAIIHFERYNGPYNDYMILDNIRMNRRFGGELIVDGAIDGQTITGAQVQTASTGARMVLGTTTQPFGTEQNWSVISTYLGGNLAAWNPGMVWGWDDGASTGALRLSSPYANGGSTKPYKGAAVLDLRGFSDESTIAYMYANTLHLEGDRMVLSSSAGSFDMNVRNTNTVSFRHQTVLETDGNSRLNLVLNYNKPRIQARMGNGSGGAPLEFDSNGNQMLVMLANTNNSRTFFGSENSNGGNGVGLVFRDTELAATGWANNLVNFQAYQVRANNVLLTSDMSQKTNVSPARDALKTVKAVKSIDYEMKKDNEKRRGLSAEEVKKVLPRAVVRNVEEDLDSVDLYALLSTLWGAVGELSSELEARLEKLESK